VTHDNLIEIITGYILVNALHSDKILHIKKKNDWIVLHNWIQILLKSDFKINIQLVNHILNTYLKLTIVSIFSTQSVTTIQIRVSGLKESNQVFIMKPQTTIQTRSKRKTIKYKQNHGKKKSK
jgi:hypothetical protein